MDQTQISPTLPPTNATYEWRRWIAENLILGNHPNSLLQVLVKSGLTPDDAKNEINTALQSPYIQGSMRLKNRIAKREWVLDIHRKLNRLRSPEVPRRHRLSKEEFLSDYYSTNQPVIITGAMDDWPAMKKWSLDYFRENFADREVEVQFGRNADENYELNKLSHRRLMKFGEYVDLVRDSGKTNDFYMTANNDSLNRQALKELWSDIGPLSNYLETNSADRGFFWLGPAGTITPFHHDLTNNFMAQVMGSKRLRIVPACESANVYNDYHCFTKVDGRNIDLARFPNMANAQVQECTLNAGEVLFLPIGCWHFVEGMEISVTVSFINFLWDNDFSSNYPKQLDF